MILSPMQRAAASLALKRLETDEKFSHSVSLLARHFGKQVAQQIKALNADYVAFNKDAKKNQANLSPEAQAYWQKVKLLIDQGQRSQDTGDRAAEAKVSAASEALEESFAATVPEVEHHKFYIHINDEKTWDNRWSYMEFRPPLLRLDLESSAALANPMNHAQQVVLGSLVQPQPTKEEVRASLSRVTELHRLARADEALEILEKLKKQNREAERLHIKSLTKKQREERRERLAARDAAMRQDMEPSQDGEDAS